MPNSRTFIAGVSATAIGAAILHDPLVKSIATLTQVSLGDLVKQFSHYCQIFRPQDLLILHYYFVNLALSGRNLKKIKEEKPAYIIVRLPQQHIGEELKKWPLEDDVVTFPNEASFSRSFVSGYSYLTFKLRGDQKKVRYNAETLLNWNLFDLITLEDLADYPRDGVKLHPDEGTYPLDLSSIPSPLAVAQIDGVAVPITLLEVPYKMFLSPVSPALRPLRETDYRYQFSRTNSLYNYFGADPKSKYHLSELWNNNLVFRILNSVQGTSFLPPHFKVVAFEETAHTEAEHVDNLPELLLPDPNKSDRSRLAFLSNLPGDNRDILSTHFNISSLGVSTFLDYFNLEDSNKSLVGWKQDIKLGRDNYAEISEKAIDSRTTLKLIVSRIAERRIEKGKSFLIKRDYFKYLERSKEFPQGITINNFVFKSIKTVGDGAYFRRHRIDDTILPDIAFIPFTEDETSIIRMPYVGIDQNGNEIDFYLDMQIIMKHGFSADSVPTILQAFNTYIVSEGAFDNHRIALDNQKVGFAANQPDETQPAGVALSNGELVTDELQFYSVFNGEYESEYPLLPNLKYARVKIPQLEGIESVQQGHYVNYSQGFNAHGLGEANQAKVFLQTLNSNITKHVVDVTLAGLEKIVEDQAKNRQSITNVFTENYRNAGSLINPDIVIDNISTLKQGITLTNDLNKLPDIRNVRPGDILRGLNTEIFGGVDLKKILKTIIPIEDSPIFQVYEEANEGFMYVEQFAGEFKKLKADVEELPKKLEELAIELKDSLLNEFASKVKNHVDKYAELKDRLVNLQIRPEKIVLSIGSWKEDFLKELRIQQVALDHAIGNKVGSEFVKIKTAVNKALSDGNSPDIAYRNQEIIVLKLLTNATKSEPKKWLELNQRILKLKVKVFAEQAKAMREFLDKDLEEVMVRIPSVTGEVVNALVKDSLESFKGAFALRKELAELISGSDLEDRVDDDNKTRTYIKGSELEVILGEGLMKSVIIGDDISGWIDFVNESWSAIGPDSERYLGLLTDGYNEHRKNAQGIIAFEKQKLEDEITRVQTEVKGDVRRIFENTQKELEGLTALKRIKSVYDYYQHAFLGWKAIRNRAELVHQAGIDLSDFIGEYDKKPMEIGQHLLGAMKTELERLAKDVEVEAKVEVDRLISGLSTLAFEQTQEYATRIRGVEQLISQGIGTAYRSIDSARERVLSEIETRKKELEEAKARVKDFLMIKLRELENNLKEENKALIDAIHQGAEEVETIRNRIRGVEEILEKLRSINKKEISYTWKTNKFDDTDLGILKFICGKQAPTELNVDITNTIHFKVDRFPPAFERVENKTKTSLSNFSLNFLGMLSVEFDNVSFEAGLNAKEKFDVSIRDVRFLGPLSFVEAFQSYLKTIDKGLRLDVSAAGAMLGYEISLPDIGGGAFNFVKARLMMDLRLPFKAGVPMRFTFGLNDPNNMFLLTAGIFGGRGCFQLAVEPKRGIVMVLLVIEFGAVLYLSLGIADGIVYLFAGIYIRREFDKIELRGYITCGGALNVLGIITVSLTFYLGLHGNGTYLDGYCTLCLEIRIAAFIKISVGLTMYKRVSGPSGSSQGSPPVAGASLLALDLYAGANADEQDSQDNDDFADNAIRITDAEWNDYFAANFHAQ